MASAEPALGRRLSVFDSNSRPPRNSTRRPSRKGRAVFKKPPSFLDDCWKAYCQATALHGIRYLVGERTAWERAFWAACVTLSAVLCGLQIAVVHGRWQKEWPPIVSVESSAPTWAVPFPAVSICPGNSAFDLNVCNNGRNVDSSDCVRKLKTSTPALSSVLKSCRWYGVPMDINNRTFTKVLTEKGICYTFNMLNVEDIYSASVVTDFGGGSDDGLSFGRYVGAPGSDWSLEKWYAPSAPWAAFPRRAVATAVAAAMETGLHMTLRANGLFQVVLHSPLDLPIEMYSDEYLFKRLDKVSQIHSARHFTFRPLVNEETVVNVLPTTTASSASLAGLSPTVRKCYYPTERRLLFFQVYTQRNCEVECVTNYTFKARGCASIFLPRLASQPVCNGSYFLTEPETIYDDCNCLPGCSTIAYDIGSSHVTWRQLIPEEDSAVSTRWSGLSRVLIQMRDSKFTTMGRSMSYGLVEFLFVDCGGLLCLFCGFSMVTLVEALFYLVIRWVYRLHKYKATA